MAREPRKHPAPKRARRPRSRKQAHPRPGPAAAETSAHGEAAAESRAEPLEAELADDAAETAGEPELHPGADLESEAGETAGFEGVEPGEVELPESGAESALVPFDPLSRYLAEIRRFPLLTREEESVIAKRYTRYHDSEDAYRLVTANLRLVVKIAMEFARASKNLLDLIQEGNVGLMEAVKNFDPYRGIRFPSYAVWWIRAYIYRYLINNWRLVKIGTTQAQRKLFFNLRKETERLEAEGFSAQPRLLAQRIGVKESEVREMQERLAQSEVSLDQPVASSEDTRLLDVLPDSGQDPEELTAGDEFRAFAKEKVQEFAATLKDKELEIFNTRLLAEEPITLQELGERFGISRERVRQIETRLKKRFKEFLKGQAGDIEHTGP